MHSSAAGLTNPLNKVAADSKPLLPAVVGALGVVYGDIGTSPLYTLREVFSAATGIPVDPHHLIGAASVIFWALMFVVTLKYVVLILRADNHGEGGVMALTALASGSQRRDSRLGFGLLMLGVFGASLFYGDSVITPAISVLSAVEGLEVSAVWLRPYVLPISVAVLIALFLVQRKGSGQVGHLFGPVMIVWFLLIGATGLYHVLQSPQVLAALNPLNAITFLVERGWKVFAAVGAIVLALTGAEALYADMAHFGKRPIRLAWSAFVLPALALSYFGQCAMLMKTPQAVSNPFFQQFPSQLVLPVVVLAAIATVIASQAVISGSFSMTKQAIQLGFLPRMRIEHTAAQEAGQVYVPLVNWLLLAAVVGAAVGFGSSSALASAYGIAVTTTMLITTMLTFFVVRDRFKIPSAVAGAATLIFAAVDVLLLASCALKFLDGGWFPVVSGLLIFLLMSTWRSGRELMSAASRQTGEDLRTFVASIGPDRALCRATRTAVYPVLSATKAPRALVHNLKHYQVIHHLNIIAVVRFLEVPYVPPEARCEWEKLSQGFWLLTVQFGFKDRADLPRVLEQSMSLGPGSADMTGVSYFMSRPHVIPAHDPAMAIWRARIFAAMVRNATSVANYYELPNNAVVELGARVIL